MRVKKDKYTVFVHSFSYIFITVFALACLIPFVLMISASFSSESAITTSGFSILPKEFSVAAMNLYLKVQEH